MHVALNNFGVDGKLDFDIIALAVSGLILLFIGAAGLGAEGTARVISIVVGLAMAGYSFYLCFLFTGDTYIMPIYAYLAPFLVIYNVIRSRNERKKALSTAANAAAYQPPPPPPAA